MQQMQQSLTFSRARLADFVACQRRFQLRYDRRLAWPAGPLEANTAEALARGRQFHQLLQRFFLGLPAAQMLNDEPKLAQWWQLFQSQGPELPPGRRLPEFNLTVPIGRHFLTGRFDLLVAGDQGLHIYDWKTEARPRSAKALRDDLQTRVYLALAAEGSPALRKDAAPDEVRLTYWYASDPPIAISLAYNKTWHAQNWAFLQELVRQIERQLATEESLPLTSDLAECRRCVYQAYCDRQTDGIDLTAWLGSEPPPQLEPDRL
jgi:hypothetical protein